MDIDKYIKKEAPNDSPHDNAYRKALLGAYDVYKDMDLVELEQWQKVARKQHDSTHNKTAACMILFELIGEK